MHGSNTVDPQVYYPRYILMVGCCVTGADYMSGSL